MFCLQLDGGSCFTDCCVIIMSGLNGFKTEGGMNLQKDVERKLRERIPEDAVYDPALKWLRENVFRVVSDAPDMTKSLHTEASNWLQWAHSRKDLKIVTVDVPDGILPKGTTGVLHDVKVFTRHGPDDVVYDSEQDIREKVARGNCFLEVCVHGGDSTVICVIHGMKKFTGGLGDDDDRTSGSDFIWQRYFTQPFDTAKVIVCTKKQNGEAAHLGAFRIGTELYICAGSKNVHLVFRSSADLEMYPLHESRYQFAKEVSRCILEMLKKLPEGDRVFLLEFLCVTRCTAVFELLSADHQHVEDLSALTAPELRFIAWTSCRLESTDSSSLTQFCCLPPDSGIELAKIFELNTIGYSVISVESLDEHMTDIRSRHGVEGEVLFFLDDNRKTIGMLKKKTVWYIVVRAIRQKVHAACMSYSKNTEAFVHGTHVHKIDQRLKEVQQWLQLNDKSVSAWKNLAEKFLTFCIEQLRAKAFSASDFTDHFPVHWNSFLLEMGQTDCISYRDQ